MFKLLQKRVKKKEEELSALKSKLKGQNIKARCIALMRLHPLKLEIAELNSYIRKRMEIFKKRQSSWES